MKNHTYRVATAMALTSLVAIATGCGSPTNLNIANPLANGVVTGGAGCISAQDALNPQGVSLNFSGTNNTYDGYEILGGQISSLDSQALSPEIPLPTIWGGFGGLTPQSGKFAGQSFGSLNINGNGATAGSAPAGVLSASDVDGQIMINLQNFDNSAGSFGVSGQKLNLTGSVIISAQKLSIIAAVMGWSSGSAIYSGSGQQTSVAQRLCFSGAAISLTVNINNAPGEQVEGGRFYLYPTSLGAVVASGSNPTSQPIIMQF